MLVREVAEALDIPTEDVREPRSLVETIGEVRDEVSMLAVKSVGRGARELSFILAKLDEARQWAIEYAQTSGDLLLIDKRQYQRDLAASENVPVANGANVPEGGSHV